MEEKQGVDAISGQELSVSPSQTNFVDLLLTLEEDAPSGELFTFLFDLLVEHSFHPPSKKGLDFFGIFFELLPRCVTPLQVVLMKRLNGLVSSFERIQLYCIKRSWISQILQMLAEDNTFIDNKLVLVELCELIETLGTLSLSPKELKEMIQFFYGQHTQTLYGLHAWCLLVDTLKRIAKNFAAIEGPSCFWDFNGKEKQSGLRLPSHKIADWRLGNGYSFCAWIYISSFEENPAIPNTPEPSRKRSQNEGAKTFRPHLYSFIDEGGKGVEVFFFRKYLVVLTKTGSNKNVYVRFNQQFKEKKWYFVTVTHMYHFVRTSVVSLHVDGELLQSESLIFPKWEAGEVSCCIGVKSSNSHPSAHEKTHPFFGRIGKIVTFPQALSDSDIKAIYALGPNVTPVLKPDTSVLSGQDGGTFLFNGRSQDIFFSYDPKATEASLCIETSTRHYDNMAMALPGMISVTVSHISNSIHAVGGIKVLLPLFEKVRAIPLEASGLKEEDKTGAKETEEKEWDEITSIYYKTNEEIVGASELQESKSSILLRDEPSCGGSLMNLLSTLLEVNEELLIDLEENGSWKVLALLLHKIPPEAWDRKTIEALDRFAAVLFHYDKLKYQKFFRRSYLYYGLWKRTSLPIQQLLFTQIEGRVKSNPQYYRKVIGVQRMVDILCRCHCPNNRITILRIVASMAYDGLTQQETKIILDSLHSEKERSHNEGTDTLKFVLALLAKRLTSSRAHDITFHLYALGGLLPFLAMLPRENEKLRIWALKVIAKLLEQATPKAKQCLLTFSSNHLAALAAAAVAGTKSSAGSLPTSTGQDASYQDNKLPSVIKHELQGFGFSRETYYALIEILLEHITIQNINTDPIKALSAKMAKIAPRAPQRRPSVSDKANSLEFTGASPPQAPSQAFVFKNPAILSAIFELLCLSRNPALQQKALEDFYFLLSSEVQNREFFLMQEHWQTWLLGILAQNLPSEDYKAPAANIFSLLIKIFTMLFHHCFYKKRGYRAIVQFQSILQHFVETGMLVGLQLTRSINNLLLQKIMGDAKLLSILQAQTQINHSGIAGSAGYKSKKEKEATDSFPESVWENIVRWIAFTEECIFVLPPPSLSVSELEDSPKRKKKEARKQQRQEGKETNDNPDKSAGYEPSDIECDASQVSELFLLRVHASTFPGSNAEFRLVEDEKEGDEARAKHSKEVAGSEKTKWKDYHFAQRLLDLMDILLLDNAAKIATYSSPKVKPLEQGILRHSLRLILYTLHETDVVLNTKRILHRRDQLGSVKEMVETYCGSPPLRSAKKGRTHKRQSSSGYNLPEFTEEQVEDEVEAAVKRGDEDGDEEEDNDNIMSSRLSEALGNYVQGKVKQWELQAKEVMNILTNNIKRLRRLVKILLSLDGGTHDNIQRVLYIVSFLFKAMKLSHTYGGMGTELMWTLFKDIVGHLQILNEIRIQLPPEFDKQKGEASNAKGDDAEREKTDGEELERKKEYVSQYLMKLFSFPPNPNSITEMLPTGGEDVPVGVPQSPPMSHAPVPSPSFLSSDALLIRRFEEAITETLSAEIRYGVAASNRLQENKHYIKIAIGKQIKEELESFEIFSALCDGMVKESSERDAERKAEIKSTLNSKFEDLQYYWQRIEYTVHTLLWGNNLSPHPTQQPQPPQSSVITSVRWKLDKRESGISGRYRQILRRDFFLADYKNCPREPADDEGELGGGQVMVTKRRSKYPPASIYFQPQLAEEDDDENVKLFLKGGSQKGREKGREKGRPQEKTVHNDVCALVTPLVTVKGNMKCTATHLYFIPSKKERIRKQQEKEREKEKEKEKENREQDEFTLPTAPKKKKWNGQSFERRESRGRKRRLSDVIGMYGRKHIHRPVALEIFFTDGGSYFLTFENKACRDAMFNKLSSIKVVSASLRQRPSSSFLKKPEEKELLNSKTGITTLWANNKISNFQYIMLLNTIAGRTYNDITQYPVFPWILNDYTSPELDLTNPNTFRDLSKPVGAQEPQRLKEFQERFYLFEDPKIPKFHYGTHYSSPAAVFYYLLRLEPFTSYFLSMQGGKFDHPDRMFHSLASTWANCLTNASDVKELIPEMFYLPELLNNINSIEFGVKNDGTPLHDVALPPWAQNDPYLFVQLHREALESDYVSEHLHEWIDLIFGYKQRGKEAVEANNVFFYLTYDDAIDIAAISDPVERKSTEEQIQNFGQTPSQLFKKPHPKRKPLELKTIMEEPPLPEDLHQSKPQFMQTTCQAPVVFIKCIPSSNEIVFVHSDGTLTTNDFIPLKNEKQQERSLLRLSGYTSSDRIERDGDKLILFKWKKDANTSRQKKLDALFPSFTNISSSCYAITGDGKIVISAASSWDSPRGNFKLITSANGSVLRNIYYGSGGRVHCDVVTCISIGTDDDTFVTGALDSTLFIWSLKKLLSSSSSAAPTPSSPLPVSASSLSNTPISTPPSPHASNAPSASPSPPTSPIQPSALASSQGPNKPFSWQKMLCGHSDAVTCASVSVEFGIVASGARDRRVLIHQIRNGRLLRSFSDRREQQLEQELPNEGRGTPARRRRKRIGKEREEILFDREAMGGVEMVMVSRVSGSIVSYYTHPNVVCVHSINGVLLQQVNLDEESDALRPVVLRAMKVMPRRRDDKEFLLMGGEGGVTIRALPSLEVICHLEIPDSPVVSLSYLEDSFVFAGLEDGQVAVFPLFIVQPL